MKLSPNDTSVATLTSNVLDATLHTLKQVDFKTAVAEYRNSIDRISDEDPAEWYVEANAYAGAASLLRGVHELAIRPSREIQSQLLQIEALLLEHHLNPYSPEALKHINEMVTLNKRYFSSQPTQLVQVPKKEDDLDLVGILREADFGKMFG